MTGGPEDGTELYADGDVPCLECGRHIAEDWDGPVVWHYAAADVWCPGSRTLWQLR